jgi:hypothetical protein
MWEISGVGEEVGAGGGRGGGGWGGEEGGAEGDRGRDDNTCSTHVTKISMNHTNLGILGGWAVGWGVYIPQNRSSVSSSLFENYSTRWRPSLCEI